MGEMDNLKTKPNTSGGGIKPGRDGAFVVDYFQQRINPRLVL